MDRVGTTSELKSVAENGLGVKFEQGNIKNFALYSDEVIIDIHNDTFEMFKLINKDDASLLVEAKDKIVDALVNEFNARSICLITKLHDGFQKYEFIECKNYDPPKKTWLDKIYDFINGISS